MKWRKFAFFGTPEYSVRVLEDLRAQDILPACVVTAPDRPKGRGMQRTPPPVKVWAETYNIPIMQPTILDDAFKENIEKTAWDMFVVMGYGGIFPKWLLELPTYGTLNVHFSLLPLYRGPTPVESQILAGATETGITIMLMDEKVDHGPILMQEVLPMPDPLPTAKELKTLLADVTAPLLIEAMNGVAAQTITPQEQDHDAATHTKRFTKSDAEIDPDGDQQKAFRIIQAFSPQPGAYFFTQKNGTQVRLKVTRATFKNDTLHIGRVIPAGKKEMDYKVFLS